MQTKVTSSFGPTRIIRLASRLLLLALVAVCLLSEPALAGISKKFLKGFLLGAYMAKHHEPMVVHMEKHG